MNKRLSLRMVEIPGRTHYGWLMSTKELIRTVNRLKPEQRVFLAAYLKHVSRVDDPAYRAELSRLNREIDEGRKFSLQQVKRMHKALEREGL